MVMQVIHRQSHGGLQGLIRRFESLKKKDVLVGITEDRATRKGEPINNAELLYIHTHGIRRKSMRTEMDLQINAGMLYSQAYAMYIMAHGSPLWAAPPRPVLEPAIEYHKDALAVLLARVIKAASKGDKTKTHKAMIRLGLKAQNVCRGWFVNPANGWAPNSPLTIKRKGSENPLIDTGSLRKSIIYVVRDVR